MRDQLLTVEKLSTSIRTGGGMLRAVNEVSIEVGRGEIVGIVGESGCGKSMTAMSIMRLLPQPPAEIVSGKVVFEGQDLLTLPERGMSEVRGRSIAMIFQDPMTFLNPVLTVETQVGEVLKRHLGLSRTQCRDRVRDLLKRVKIPDPDRVATSYPHQLSGGMRQRILIATAISCNPKLLIADEPTTALDVTVQAQILELLKEIIRDMGSSLMLITHDLGVVAETCDRVYVMYAGRVVETSDVRSLFSAPRHPYTKGLLKSVLRADQSQSEIYALDGSVPNLIQTPAGCSFRDRCSEAIEPCATMAPPWIAPTRTGGVACWRCKQ